LTKNRQHILLFNSLLNFLSSFSNRSGNYILIASIASRFLSFFASWIALQIIPSKNLGVVIYAFQFILFISPIASLGLNQGLFRYGSFLKSIEKKNKLFSYALKKGLLVSSIFTLIIILISFIIDFETPKTSFYLRLLSLMIITQFLFEILQIQFRLQKKNKKFAFVETTYNISLVILVSILSYYFKELGYAIALISTPLLIFIFFIKDIKFKWHHKDYFNFIDFSFWKYGFFASISSVTTVMLVSIDIVLISYLTSDMNLVTTFKYVSIIPFSILFLSRAFMSIDFVVFTEKIDNKIFIFNYIKNYILFFSIISIGFLITIILLGKYLLLILDPTYPSYYSTLVVLSIGVTGILILRGLFDNLLSSIGKSHVSFIILSLAIILNISLNFYLIPIYGIIGAAITSAVLMWFTGILCMFFFFYYFDKFIKNHQK
jgi:O-antigen/teichoic acid export membrane protein